MFSLILKLILSLISLAKPAIEIEVAGSINPGSADYIISSIQKANQDNVGAFIMRMNTPGGLISSTRNIIQAINESAVPIIVFVTPAGGRATSAGALIALSAHKVIMMDGTNIGAAHPVGPGGESPEGAMKDKAVQDTAALARSQAQLRNRNVELAEKMVTKSLAYSAKEAKGKKLIDQVVSSEDEFLDLIKAEFAVTDFKRYEMNTKQKLLHSIADPNFSTLLLSLAGIAIYTEISSGFTLIAPGVLGILMLILGFVSLQMLPIQTGGTILMGMGLLLLIAELFVISYGLLAIAGIVALFVGSLFLVDTSQLGVGVSPSLIGSILFALSTLVGFFGFIVWRDSKVKIKSGLDSLIGEKAIVKSIHSPFDGVISIQGELWNCKSDRPLEVGQTVTIKEFHSDHFVVI
jgi:membrane-bound serine protease (ClpP class)